MSATKHAAFTAKLATVRRSSGQALKDLLANERADPEQLALEQLQRAQVLASFAAESTAFYRALFADAGIDQRDLKDRDAWAAIPISDRTDIRDAGDRLQSTEWARGHVRHGLTSGSTGEPLRTAHDARVPGMPLYWRMVSWWGIDPADDVVHIGRWGTPGWRRRVAHWPSREIMFDAVRFDDHDIDRLVGLLQHHRPPLIEGYLGALQHIAGYLVDHGIEIPAPVAVGTTSAPLPSSTRTQIAGAFDAPVHDQYRSAEIPWIAAECGHRDGLHIFADRRLVEVVDDDGAPVGPGVEGDLVVTDLDNRVAPLIRYRIGDRGALRPGRCGCGRTLPLMEPVIGRATDVLHLPDGSVISAGFPLMFAHDPAAARSFQIHQHRDHSLTLRVVPGETEHRDASIRQAAEVLRDLVNHTVPVNVEFARELPMTAGKIRYVSSDLASHG